MAKGFVKGIAAALAAIIVLGGATAGIGRAVTGTWDPTKWGKTGTECVHVDEDGDGVCDKCEKGMPAEGDNQGEQNETPTVVNGKDGVDGKDGKDGVDGKDGADGVTPHIGENGNWYIGEVDTGVKAAGTDGQDGQDGKDGADGQTPYIGENGNWFIGEEDTGVSAAGNAGESSTAASEATYIVAITFARNSFGTEESLAGDLTGYGITTIPTDIIDANGNIDNTLEVIVYPLNLPQGVALNSDDTVLYLIAKKTNKKAFSQFFYSDGNYSNAGSVTLTVVKKLGV